jgi:two-component system sensor histidine kinase TctE
MSAGPDASVQWPAARSLRGRLLGLLLAPLGALLLAGLVVDYIATVGPLRQAYDQALAGSAVAVAAHVRTGPTGQILAEPSPPARAALGLTQAAGDRYYSVRTADGATLAGEPGLPAAHGPENPALGRATWRGAAVRLATFRLDSAAGPILVTVADVVASRERASRYLILTTLTLAVVQLAAILFLVWLAVRRGLEPLLRVEGRLAARSARELEPVEERTVPEEVRGLVRALNELFLRVRASAEAQQQFLANAAHQLRTPLAGMQAQLELLAREPALGAERERVLALHDSARRLAHTASQLLTLARAEASATTHRDFAAVDLKLLVDEAVARELDRAIARGIDLGAESAPVGISGVAWLLRELIANLLDNALAYSPRGGVVTVRCARDGRRALLEVEDDGPGIPEAERARVVERFYRIPGGAGHGSGLGLAIVSDVARLHGAELALAPGRAGRGLCARVTFPGAT